MDGGIFLTIKDYMRLIGTDCYSTAAKEHKLINKENKAIKNRKKRKITILEYCNQEGLDFAYVWEFLRAKPKKN